MSDLLNHCLTNILRKGSRSLMTIFSIAIGVCSVVLISSLGSAGGTLIDRELSQLGLDGAVITADKKQTDYRLNEADREVLQNLEGVEAASGVILEAGLVRMHGLISDALAWGLDENAQEVMCLELLHGRFLNRKDLRGNVGVCMMDARSAREFYHRENIVGKTLTFEYNGRRREFEVVGIVEAGGAGFQSLVGEYIPTFLYLPETVLQQMTGKAGYNQISLTLNPEGEASEETLANAVELRSGMEDVFLVQDLGEQNQRLGGALLAVRVTLMIIAAISMVVAALGTMTVMSAAVQERTKEIGIKKAIGASNARIMAEFLMESAVLSLMGALLGSGAAAAAVRLSSVVFGSEIGISGILPAVLIAMSLGTLFGMVPAKQAARLNPIDALRSDG